MAMALQAGPRPLCCRRAGTTKFAIGPPVGPFYVSPCCKGFPRIRVVTCMAASSDYPRRRPRKSSIPKTKGSTPKGFTPRPQVGTSTQKKDQMDNEKKEGLGTSGTSEYTVPEAQITEVISSSTVKSSTSASEKAEELDNEEKEGPGISGTSEYTVPKTQITEVISSSPVKRSTSALEEAEILSVGIEEMRDEKAFAGKPSAMIDSDETEEFDDQKDRTRTKHLAMVDNDQIVEKESVDIHYDNIIESHMLIEKEVSGAQSTEVVSKSSFSSSLGKFKTGTLDEMDEHIIGINDERGTITPTEKHSVLIDREEHTTETEELEKLEEGVETEESDIEGSLVKQKAEMDAQTQKQMLEDLVEGSLSKGNKVFVYPQVVQPDQIVEVFLNRSISALMNEPDILIMGAFNDWRWKSFTEKLHSTNLKGDWWSCRVHVPKEAYKMDFVFFNGGNVYENNNLKDFFIPVEGGMDASAFEVFLLEEKQRELEKLAAEEAEREKQAEEQRRKEAEKAASEADRTQAKVEVEKKREALHRVKKLAIRSVDNLWHIEPSMFKGEDMVRLFYNRSSRPLAHATELWIHGGHNNWMDGLSIVKRLLHSEKKDGDWWYADVVVPDRAVIMDWVFADGPPHSAKVYDNNNRQDFHAIVPNCMSEELYWVEEEHQIYKKLQEERKMKEEIARRKAEKTARMKAGMKQRAMKMFLLSQKHIVYTEPLEVRAGSTVTVFYNPSITVLSGKPEVWIRCSFNRWSHRNGPLPPQKMVPTDNGSHVKATVKVPLDAYMMDFVFSEREDGGIYDNKNGMDYHIPVTGGVSKEPPMYIVHVAVEMAPIAKVGGLGDVVTSLSRAVQDIGHSVNIILPKYDCMNLSNVRDFHFHRSFAWGGTEIKVWFGKVEGLSVYFLEPQNGMFGAGCIYGCRNDAERFGFFCHAALEFLLQSGSHPDILHCHDWSSAPVAWLYKEHYRHSGLSNARVIFTIHNLEFGVPFIGKAMTHADKATTVSRTYSKEVSGNPVIAPHLYKFHGILNGIDPDIWDPYNDNFIPIPYTSDNVVEGKKAAKEALQQRLGLKRSDHPLVGVISRLTVQKGIHLIKHAIWRTLDRNGQVVLLGSAPDHRIQNDFVNLANQLHSSHADRARLCLTYDEPLSHLIYAGSDFILVPSIFEPCGLTQLIAMRYGSIPVVRKTGGLYDTVFDVDNDKERAQAQGLEPNGFCFDGADAAGVDYALDRALSAWYDGRDWFNSLCKHVMEQDWSWNRPALDYMELYYAARK